MSIPLPLQEAITLPAAQSLLQSGFASALAQRTGVSALNLTTAFTVDAQGTIRPSSAFMQGLVLPGLQNAVQMWFGVDAWNQTQTFTNQSVNDNPAFVPSPDVLQLYQLTQTQLPAITQVQLQPQTQAPDVTTTTGAADTATPMDVAAPVIVQPSTPLPTLTGPSPLAVTGAVMGASGVQPLQGTTQWADWLREQTAVALSEIVNNLKPTLPPIFEEQLQLTQAEADTLRAAGEVLLPLTSGLEYVTDLMRPAQETIDAGLLTPLETVRNDLADASAQVREHVVQTIGAASAAIDSGRTVAVEPIRQALETAQESLATTAGYLEATAAEKIANAQELIAQAMAETVSTDQALVEWFQTLIPTPETFVQDVTRQVRQQCEDLPPAVVEALGSGFANGISANVNGNIPQDLSNLLGTFLSGCANLKDLALGGAAIGLLGAIVTGGAGAALELLGGLFNMLVVEGLTSKVLDATLGPNLLVTEYDAFKSCPVRLATLEQAVFALRTGAISQVQFDDLARKHGHDSVNAAIAMNAQRALLTPQDLFSYEYRRAGAERWAGEEFVQQAEREAELLRADAAPARDGLRELGFAQADIDKLFYTSHEIPSIQDLIRFATRDAFFPDIVEKFQADAEFPVQLQPFAEQQGLTGYWQHKFWQAHWELPSLQQAYTMYHRVYDTPQTPDAEPVTLPSGKVVYRGIGRADLQRLQRAAGMELYWRDLLTGVAFHPLTRVDTRRAYNLDVIDKDEVFKQYLAQGYDAHNAQVLTDFSTTLKEQANKSALIEPQKSIALTFTRAYEHGVIDEHALTFALTDLGYDPQVAALTAANGRLERDLRLLTDSIAAVKSRFIRGKSTQEQVREQLTQVGIGEQEINRYLQVWCLQVGCDTDNTVADKEKEVTKAEILSFYDDGLVSAGTATDRIVALGYSQDDARLIVANAQIKRLRANLKQTIKSTHDNYLSGTIDRLTASNELDAIGVPTETRQIILDQWQQELTQSEIKRAREVYLGEGDHLAEALAILAPLGLPPDEVDRLLALWQGQKAAISGIVPAVPSTNGSVVTSGA